MSRPRYPPLPQALRDVLASIKTAEFDWECFRGVVLSSKEVMAQDAYWRRRLSYRYGKFLGWDEDSNGWKHVTDEQEQGLVQQTLAHFAEQHPEAFLMHQVYTDAYSTLSPLTADQQLQKLQPQTTVAQLECVPTMALELTTPSTPSSGSAELVDGCAAVSSRSDFTAAAAASQLEPDVDRPPEVSVPMLRSSGSSSSEGTFPQPLFCKGQHVYCNWTSEFGCYLKAWEAGIITRRYGMPPSAYDVHMPGFGTSFRVVPTAKSSAGGQLLRIKPRIKSRGPGRPPTILSVNQLLAAGRAAVEKLSSEMDMAPPPPLEPYLPEPNLEMESFRCGSHLLLTSCTFWESGKNVVLPLEASSSVTFLGTISHASLKADHGREQRAPGCVAHASMVMQANRKLLKLSRAEAAILSQEEVKLAAMDALDGKGHYAKAARIPVNYDRQLRPEVSHPKGKYVLEPTTMQHVLYRQAILYDHSSGARPHVLTSRAQPTCFPRVRRIVVYR